MNRTLSKERKETKFSNPSLKKTEKKRTHHQESMDTPEYSNLRQNSQKFRSVLQQGKNTQIGILRNSVNSTSHSQKKYLRVCNLLRLKGSRARLFDWLLDVCRGFELRWETYWCAIEIIDFQIFTSKSVTLQNIHLVGVASLFMATKIHQKVLPSLDAIVNNAVYNAFSEQDIVQKEAEILLKSANSSQKPCYMSTIYNSLYEIYPNLSVKERQQALRRLILVWVDPVTAFKAKQRASKNNAVHVLYDDIVKTVVTNMKRKVQNSTFDDIRNYFKKEQECMNFQPGWPGFDKMVI